MSVAERVSDELAEDSVGKLVGYQIRLEAKRTAATRLLFCTTGVVLRRFIEDPNLDGITHGTYGCKMIWNPHINSPVSILDSLCRRSA